VFSNANILFQWLLVYLTVMQWDLCFSVFSTPFSIVDNERSSTIVVANENGGYVSVRPG